LWQKIAHHRWEEKQLSCVPSIIIAVAAAASQDHPEQHVKVKLINSDNREPKISSCISPNQNTNKETAIESASHARPRIRESLLHSRLHVGSVAEGRLATCSSAACKKRSREIIAEKPDSLAVKVEVVLARPAI
jgi:hypothetical protein